jgi:hypothetical protein
MSAASAAGGIHVMRIPGVMRVIEDHQALPAVGLEVAVDAFDGAVEGDEPVPLDRGQPGDGLGGLLVDPA